MSRYSILVQEWKDCGRCELSERRHKVVMARGTVPCDILFIGEAPGESEDALGKPFVGPAGQLLDIIINRSIGKFNKALAIAGGRAPLTWCLTNLVGCIPRGEDQRKAGEPEPESIEACAPRLQELAAICDPQLIICVGKLAEEYMGPGFKHSIKLHKPIKQVTITHPSAILRANPTQKGLMTQRNQVIILDALDDLC